MKSILSKTIIGAFLLGLGSRAMGADLTCSSALERAPRLSLTQEAKGVMERMQKFAADHPRIAQMIEQTEVNFSDPKGEVKWRNSRNVMVVSVKGLNPNEVEALRQNVMRAMGKHSISLPLSEQADHLFTRVGDATFDYDYRYGGANRDPAYWTFHLFKNRYYLLNSYEVGKRKLEPVISMTEDEYSNLQKYLDLAARNVVDVVGKFDFDGSQYANGTLEKNVPPQGGHNCTSWLMTSHVGERGDTLMSLLGPRSPYQGYVQTNPGWLLGYLMTHAKPERTPVAILWTTNTVEQEVQNLKEKNLTDWKFNATALLH